MANSQTTLPFEGTASLSFGAKKCSKCNETKPLSVFLPRYTKSGKLTYRDHCRACENKKQRAKNAALPIERRHKTSADQYAKRKAQADLNPITQSGVLRSRCPRCETEKPVTQFYRNRAQGDGISSYCIPCTNDINKACRKKLNAKMKVENPKLRWAKAVFGVRRATAKKQDVPFKIDAAYLVSIAPDTCPVLGIPLRYVREEGRKGTKADSASVDKFIPELGYVHGNVCVISHKANTIKSDGNVADVAKLLAWMLKNESVSDEARAEATLILGLDWTPPIKKAA